MIHRASRWLSLGILLILAVVYGITLAPGLSWANDGTDGGDLITAAATGGVPHPTGYPSYLVLANAFQQLPVGELAFRTNLMSAVFACLAALFIYRIIHLLTAGSGYQEYSAFIGAIVFGVAPLVWSQAVITEVYTFQAFLTALVLYQAFLPGTGKIFLFIRGLLVGLALGNHITSLFLIPVLLWQEGNVRVRPALSTTLKFIGLLAGLLIYAILPLRALGQPPINWENPITLDGFLGLVTGRIYQSYFTSEFVIDRLRGWCGLLIHQFGLAGVALGIYALLDGRKLIVRVLPLVWVFIAQSTFLLFYGPRDSYIYLIAPVLVFSVWIALGVSKLLLVSAQIHRVVAFFMALLFLVVNTFSAVQTFEQVDASKDAHAEDFGRLIMHLLPEDSLVFTEDDPSTFALWYFHFALKERTDVTILVKSLLPYDWYRQNLETTYPDLKMPDHGNLSVVDLRALNPNNIVCFVGYAEKPRIKCPP